jgi:hypothetical protein
LPQKRPIRTNRGIPVATALRLEFGLGIKGETKSWFPSPSDSFSTCHGGPRGMINERGIVDAMGWERAPDWSLAPVYHRWWCRWRGLDMLQVQDSGYRSEAGSRRSVCPWCTGRLGNSVARGSGERQSPHLRWGQRAVLLVGESRQAARCRLSACGRVGSGLRGPRSAQCGRGPREGAVGAAGIWRG